MYFLMSLRSALKRQNTPKPTPKTDLAITLERLIATLNRIEAKLDKLEN